MTRFAILTVGAVLFCVLVILNVGGYRYGVSDQAFYLPVVLQGLEPDLYPHDAPLIAAQDRFFTLDDWLAPILDATGLSVPIAFLIGYGLSLMFLYAAAVTIGRTLYRSWWSIGGLIIGLTLRHRIPDTAVNTLESYFHPRLLAFGIGLVGVALFLRNRTWPALAIIALSFWVHPTTALWFTIWVFTAALVADRKSRQPLLSLALVGTTAAALAIAGLFREQLVVMDDTWVRVLASKDYLIASDWPLLTWIGNLAVAAVIGVIYQYRRSLGITSDRETGLVVGCAALLGLFLLSVPLSTAHLAFVVQLQVNRIFWLLDIFASCYLGWLLFESPFWLNRSTVWTRHTVRRAAVVGIAVLAIVRGSYVMIVERSGHPLIQTHLAQTHWNRVMSWASDQPVGTFFLTDPGHAWRYGTSVRAASGRDVYLEEVKDIGIAIYSRAAAHEVARRIADLGNFDQLEAQQARNLARQYDLDYLITEKSVELPLTRKIGQFAVYDLQQNRRFASRKPIRPTN